MRWRGNRERRAGRPVTGRLTSAGAATTETDSAAPHRWQGGQAPGWLGMQELRAPERDTVRHTRPLFVQTPKHEVEERQVCHCKPSPFFDFPFSCSPSLAREKLQTARYISFSCIRVSLRAELHTYLVASLEANTTHDGFIPQWSREQWLQRPRGHCDAPRSRW